MKIIADYEITVRKEANTWHHYYIFRIAITCIRVSYFICLFSIPSILAKFKLRLLLKPVPSLFNSLCMDEMVDLDIVTKEANIILCNMKLL